MRFDVNKHIEFRLMQEFEKTKMWMVINTWAHCGLGVVKWYREWRHYCFFPYDESVFSDRCMLKIGQFVESQNKQHRSS